MIRIIAVGKVKEKGILDLINEYLKRMQGKVEIIEVRDLGKEKEGEKIMSLCEGKKIIAMDETGKEYTSEEFSDKIDGDMVFVIGGPEGLSDNVKKNEKIALSRMTFTHEMARLFLVEQIYRTFQIKKGTKYHK